MAEKFREDVFVRALLDRSEDAAFMANIFRPEWLNDAELQVVLQEVYQFLEKYQNTPSIDTLRELFKARNEIHYENRHKAIIDRLERVEQDLSLIIYTMDQAREVAVGRSLDRLYSSPAFAELSGSDKIKELESWMRTFYKSDDLVEMNLKEAYAALKKGKSWEDEYIKCGIKIFDDWCGGRGLKKKNLAIILAPTGGGKSQGLTQIAFQVASTFQHRVLYLTNELTMDEVTERLVARMTGVPLDKVLLDPAAAERKLERYWNYGIDEYLRIIEVKKAISASFIEARINHYKRLYGWKPDLIVLDYMERMKPVDKAVRRDQSWNWLGEVARDLMWVGKRGDYLIWTAAQMNRAGMQAVEQSLDQAQGSIQHLQEAALVVALRQIDYQIPGSDNIVLQCKPLKTRHARRPPKALFVEADFSRSTITDRVLDILPSFTPDQPDVVEGTVGEHQKKKRKGGERKTSEIA